MRGFKKCGMNITQVDIEEVINMKDFLEDVLFWILIGIGMVIVVIMWLVAIPFFLAIMALCIAMALFPVMILSTMFSGWELFWMSAWSVPLWVLFLISSQKDFEDRLFY